MPPSPPPPSTSEPISVLLDTASATANLSQSRTLLSQLETLRDSLSSRVDQLSSAVERLRVQAGELERALVDDTGPEASRSRTETTPRQRQDNPVPTSRPPARATRPVRPSTTTRSRDPGRIISLGEMNFILDRASEPPVYIPLQSSSTRPERATNQRQDGQVVARLIRHTPPVLFPEENLEIPFPLAREGYFPMPGPNTDILEWETRYGLHFEWTEGSGPATPGRSTALYVAPVVAENQRPEAAEQGPIRRLNGADLLSLGTAQLARDRSRANNRRGVEDMAGQNEEQCRRGMAPTNTSQQRHCVPIVVRSQTTESPCDIINHATSSPLNSEDRVDPPANQITPLSPPSPETSITQPRYPYRSPVTTLRASVLDSDESIHVFPSFSSSILLEDFAFAEPIIDDWSLPPGSISTPTPAPPDDTNQRERRTSERREQLAREVLPSLDRMTARAHRVEARMDREARQQAPVDVSPQWEETLYEIPSPISTLSDETIHNPLPPFPRGPHNSGRSISERMRQAARLEGARLRLLAEDISQSHRAILGQAPVPSDNATNGSTLAASSQQGARASNSQPSHHRNPSSRLTISRPLHEEARQPSDAGTSTLAEVTLRDQLRSYMAASRNSAQMAEGPTPSGSLPVVVADIDDSAGLPAAVDVIIVDALAIDPATTQAEPPSERPRPAQQSQEPVTRDMNQPWRSARGQAAREAVNRATNSISPTTERRRAEMLGDIERSRARIRELARLRADMDLVRNGPSGIARLQAGNIIRGNEDFTMDLADIARLSVQQTGTSTVDRRIGDDALPAAAEPQPEAPQESVGLGEDEEGGEKDDTPAGSTRTGGLLREDEGLNLHLWPVPPIGSGTSGREYVSMLDLE